MLGYLQFGFNSSLVLLSLYLLSSFLYMLSSDVSERLTEYSLEYSQEIMHCSESYITNRCSPPELRVPALEKACRDWEFCMNRNPKIVGRTKVVAETVAETVNSFVEVISWRTMLFLLTTLAIVVGYLNTSITSYRRSHPRSHEHDDNARRRPDLHHMPASAPPGLASIGGSDSEKTQKAR